MTMSLKLFISNKQASVMFKIDVKTFVIKYSRHQSADYFDNDRQFLFSDDWNILSRFLPAKDRD